MPGPWSSRLRHAVVREEGGYLLELLAVTGFAVTQPVLDVFGRSAETFVAEGATAHDVLGFGLAFAVVPAVLLLAVGLLSRPVGPRARQGVHRATVGVATGAFVVQALMRG